MPTSPHLLPLRDLAREMAVEILADAGGRRRVSELLAVAFLRGYVTANHDAASAERHVRVLTGTGNSAERTELAALCRGLKESA